jgi:exodeoxyribonuclease VII large subunit
VTRLLTTEVDRLEQVRSRPALATSAWLIDSRSEEIARYLGRNSELVGHLVEKSLTRVTELRAQLRALSPQRSLDRGFAIAQLPSGAVLRRTADAPVGTPLLLTLADGSLGATVDSAPAAGPGSR